MSDYGHAAPTQDKPSFVSGCDLKAKEARKQVLAEVAQRRRINYKKLMEKKRRLQVKVKDLIPNEL